MRFQETSVAGARLIIPQDIRDDRGRFRRIFCAQEFADNGIDFMPVQANMGYSITKGTTRGMHWQEAPALEAKLVRCTTGAIFDVVLDLRPESPTYRKWYSSVLSPENGRMLYLPERCAHGYQTLEDHTEMHYMASANYTPEAARGARHDDPAFEINWPMIATAMSAQDRSWPLVDNLGVQS